jgi:putative addiction module component (TIGR02574 family)
MSELLTKRSQQACKLDPEEHEQLIEQLLASLAEGLSDEVDAAWETEIKRRLAAIENPGTQLIAAEDVFTEIEELLSHGRPFDSAGRQALTDAPQQRRRSGQPHPRPLR